jgi:hypothetical protein
MDRQTYTDRCSCWGPDVRMDLLDIEGGRSESSSSAQAAGLVPTTSGYFEEHQHHVLDSGPNLACSLIATASRSIRLYATPNAFRPQMKIRHDQK